MRAAQESCEFGSGPEASLRVLQSWAGYGPCLGNLGHPNSAKPCNRDHGSATSSSSSSGRACPSPSETRELD
jgi:hypothetical protein